MGADGYRFLTRAVYGVRETEEGIEVSAGVAGGSKTALVARGDAPALAYAVETGRGMVPARGEGIDSVAVETLNEQYIVIWVGQEPFPMPRQSAMSLAGSILGTGPFGGSARWPPSR